MPVSLRSRATRPSAGWTYRWWTSTTCPPLPIWFARARSRWQRFWRSSKVPAVQLNRRQPRLGGSRQDSSPTPSAYTRASAPSPASALATGETRAAQNLNSGILPVGSKRRVGQQVGRRLGVAERHEHHADRHVAVGAHLDLDRSAARLQRASCHRARGRADAARAAPGRPPPRARARRARRRGASSTPCASAPARGRSRAPSGSPCRALRPADECVAGTILARPFSVGKPVVEDDVVARHIRRIDRIGHRAFALQTLPGDVVERRHRHGHLGEHLGRTGVVPVQAQTLARSPG